MDDCGNNVHVPNGKVTLTMRDQIYQFQRVPDSLCYSLTLQAGPFPSGDVQGCVSARAGAHTYGALYIRFMVEPSNSVVSIQLEEAQHQVVLSKVRSMPVNLDFDFGTEDQKGLAPECIDNCQLVWTGPGNATHSCNLPPGPQFVYGHKLKVSAKVPFREPGTYQVLLEYTESRPNLRKGKIKSNAARVHVQPGRLRPSTVVDVGRCCSSRTLC